MDPIALDLRKQIPHLPAAIERRQLLARLQSALRYRLILISAPPGYGKTTIAAQFAEQAPYPVAWHTIEEHERDFPSLFNHCLATLEPLVEGISGLRHSLDENSPSELAMHIDDYVRQARASDFIYVLDDIHHLDGMLPCETWLRTLMMRLPRFCHTILISRTLPNLSYAGIVARNEIFTLGPSDLRLTEDEIHKLAEETLGIRHLGTDRETLSALDGWPAGVFLALQPLPTNFTESMFGIGGGPEMLFEALARPMLHAQPPDLRHFLLSSSTLPRLTPELCEKVLRLSNSAEWLTVAQKRNLFVSKVAAGLEYHDLFRDFLQRELRIADPDGFADLHLQAAQWFEQIDDIEQAFNHFIAAGRLERAQLLAERAAFDYFGQGKFETVLDWSRHLQEADILAPNLSLECSMIYTDRYEYDAAESELVRAVRGFKKAEDKMGLAKVQLQRAMLHRKQGEYRKALELAEEIASLQIDELRGRALRIIGFAHLRLGDAASAILYLEEAVRLYRKEGLVSPLSHLLQDLQYAYMRLGRLDDMGRCLQEVVALRRKLGGRSALAFALNSLGYYYHRCGNYKEAISTFEEGLRLVAGVPDRRSESYLFASMGDLKRDLGLYVDAQQLYDRALEQVTPEAEPVLYCTILVSLSTLRRWQGRADEAALLAEEASHAAADGAMFEVAMSKCALWLARAELNDPCQALNHLRVAIEDLRRQGAHFEMLEVLGGCIHVAATCSEEKAASEYLMEAFRLADEVGTAQSLVAEIAHRPSLEVLVAQMPQSAQVLADLKKLREAQADLSENIDTVSAVSPTRPYSLRVFTLGQEKVERDGKPITIAEWQAAVPRELFFYLFFSGPKRRAEIELVLWPESSPDQARGLFHTTLHRARQAVGPDAIVFEDDRYFIDLDVKVECDTHQLESWTTQARLLPPHDARADDLWRKAVAVYGGEFLHSLDGDWVRARREAYSDMYIDALLGLGHCARARSDLQVAVEWFSAAVAADPYSEDSHRQMMRCYAQMGEMGKVRTCFYELKTILKNELGVQPSEETMTLARNIIGSL